MRRRFLISKEQVAEAIRGTGGIITQIAKKMDCDWHTARKYINKWELTRTVYADETEKILDLCESQIIRSINDGNVQDAKWMLSNKAKHRGYGIDASIQVDDKTKMQEANEKLKEYARHLIQLDSTSKTVPE